MSVIATARTATPSAGTAIAAMVARQAAASPSAPALVAGTHTVTYAELELRADRIAHRLRSAGVTRNDLVAVCMNRSPELVICQLAVWKSHAAYVALDPAYPGNRLAFMLHDCAPRVLIAESQVAERLGADAPAIVPDAADSDRLPAVPPEAEADDKDLAYVIYTSGSTGRPKGVEVTHAGLMNLVSWHLEQFQVRPDDRATHLAGVGFDASVWEVWPYLAGGASVHMVCDEIRTDPEALREWLLRERITISFAPTVLAERLIRLPWPASAHLRLLLTGADALHSYPRSSLPFKLINNYGPTECTVVATSGEVAPNGEDGSPPTIGRPIRDTEIHILDEQLQAVPAGSPGEICIGGAGLARGYLNAPELTAQSFVPHPFRKGARIYRTGDRGRVLPNGELEFLGRVDALIKLRGYRIEPAEITSQLRRHPDIVEAAVAARHIGCDEPQLVAYVVRAPGRQVTASALRRHLRSFLPDYMLPACFVDLEALSVTVNGKLDPAALPSPAAAVLLAEEPAPAPPGRIDAQLRQIVSSLLHLDSIGLDENIFMLGGHSLMAAQLIVRVRECFGVEVGLREVFHAQTLRRLAAEIESSGQAAPTPAKQSEAHTG